MALHDNALMIFALLMIMYAGMIAASDSAAADPLTSDMNFLKDVRSTNNGFFKWLPTEWKNPASMTSPNDVDYNFSENITTTVSDKTALEYISETISSAGAFLAVGLNYIAYLINFMVMLLFMPIGYYTLFTALKVPYIITFPVIVFISFIHVYCIARMVIEIKGSA